MKKLLVLMPLLVAACTNGPSDAERETLVTAKASNDLRCPAKNISLTIAHSDGGQFLYGKKLVVFNARGCGRQQVYDNIGSSVYKSYGAQ